MVGLLLFPSGQLVSVRLPDANGADFTPPAHPAERGLADAVVTIVADAVAVHVGGAGAATDVEGIELVAVAIAVAFRQVRTSAFVDGTGTVTDAAFVLVDAQRRPIDRSARIVVAGRLIGATDFGHARTRRQVLPHRGVVDEAEELPVFTDADQDPLLAIPIEHLTMLRPFHEG